MARKLCSIPSHRKAIAQVILGRITRELCEVSYLDGPTNKTVRHPAELLLKAAHPSLLLSKALQLKLVPS